MGKPRKQHEETKNREAERALQKVIGGINIGKAKVKRFNLWPTSKGVSIHMQVDYEDDDERKDQ
jgi:hypothetical protein